VQSAEHETRKLPSGEKAKPHTVPVWPEVGVLAGTTGTWVWEWGGGGGRMWDDTQSSEEGSHT
jgi:hypothetical protein